MDQRPSQVGAVERLAWADVAKGLCILLVVLHHELSKDLAYLGLDGGGWVQAAWREIDSALSNARMPVFFLVSGLLAAPAMHRRWGQVFRRRVASPYYLFVLWSVLQGAFFLVGPAFHTDPLSGVGELATDLVVPTTTVWYLFALPVYFVVAKLLAGRVPTALVLLAAALLFTAVRAGALPQALAGNEAKVLAYPLFFLLGALAPGHIQALARAASWPRAALVAAAFLGISTALSAADLRAIPGVALVAAALALAGGLWISALLVRSAPRPAAALGALGRRTLPIYVLHVPILALIHAMALQSIARWPAATTTALVWPLAASGAAIALSLALHRLLVAAGGSLLFALPGGTPRPAVVPAEPRRRLTAAEVPAPRFADAA